MGTLQANQTTMRSQMDCMLTDVKGELGESGNASCVHECASKCVVCSVLSSIPARLMHLRCCSIPAHCSTHATSTATAQLQDLKNQVADMRALVLDMRAQVRLVSL